MNKIASWLLVGCSVLMLLSAATFAVQGGFGAGDGNFDLLIYLAGMPWTAITWPPAVMRSDVIWLIALPYCLDLTAIVGIAAIMRFFGETNTKSVHNPMHVRVTEDEREALKVFATHEISVEQFLYRMASHVKVGRFAPGNREVNVGPLPLEDVTVSVTRDDVRWVVQRYVYGEMSGEELSNWAGLLLAISAYVLPSNEEDDDVLGLLTDLALPLEEQYLDRESVKDRIARL